MQLGLANLQLQSRLLSNHPSFLFWPPCRSYNWYTRLTHLNLLADYINGYKGWQSAFYVVGFRASSFTVFARLSAAPPLTPSLAHHPPQIVALIWFEAALLVYIAYAVRVGEKLMQKFQ